MPRRALCLVAVAHTLVACEPASQPPVFVDVTVARGIKSETASWPPPAYFTPEITGGGVALLDYDNDGDLDLLQVRHPPSGPWHKARNSPAPNRLYRQEGDGSFTDVTAAAGIGDPGYGHGVAVGDVDDDGDLDVYITNFGPDVFYRNQGDGTFVNDTVGAGIAGDYWSSSAVFLDYDRDGDLDLYVVHFAEFDPDARCSDVKGKADFCPPQRFDGVVDTLYRNDGGVFEDVSHAAGIHTPGRGWGVIALDLTGDALLDIYVANDEEPNQLWVNQGDGTFREDALTHGVAVNGAGEVEASMGVVAGDVDGDGSAEIFVTHIDGETNTLYTRYGGTYFVDRSAASRLGMASLPMTGWGCGFFDFDHDGDLDLVAVNGRVSRRVDSGSRNEQGPWLAYAEANTLFENDGSGTFTVVHEQAGEFGSRQENTRGIAFGDLDNDGDMDLVVNNIDNTLRIYRNDAPSSDMHWLRVRTLSGRHDVHGAIVTVVTGQRELTRISDPGYGYLSSSDPRAHFGLGKADRVDSLRVRWPDGSVEAYPAPAKVDSDVIVSKGQGAIIP